jgi:hypothetical protein
MSAKPFILRLVGSRLAVDEIGRQIVIADDGHVYEIVDPLFFGLSAEPGRAASPREQAETANRAPPAAVDVWLSDINYRGGRETGAVRIAERVRRERLRAPAP